MFTFFLIVSIIFLFIIFQAKKNNWRNSLLSALLAWGVILTAITEILSGLNLLKFEWVTILWLSVDIILVLTYFRQFRKKPKLKFHKLFNLPFFSHLILGGVALIVTLVGLVAIVAAPNHSDSMEYHMSRVASWMQNHSVAHYATFTLEQLYQNPWSEFAIMHFQILSGGDRFANLIQWGSMVGSLVGVSSIAKQLGANLRGQILATVFCVTIPMGILQASSTNNDYVVSFWLVCFAYSTLSIVKEGISTMNTFLLGASLGLAILTKGTAYIYAFPFCIWLAFWGIKNLRWQIWKPIALVFAIVLLLNFGHYIRNLTLFSSPLGKGTGETNKVFSTTIFISSTLKNLALHADIVRHLSLEHFIPPITGAIEKIIKIIHGFLGIDINDPRLMNPKSPKFYVPRLSIYEDTAGNPIHLALILLSSIVFLANKKLRQQSNLVNYFLVVSAGFFLFCFLFTWSPWRCRLHLPLFILFSAFVGVILSKFFSYRITNILALLLLLLSHPWVLNNSVRPLVGSQNIFNTPRIEQYFATQPSYQNSYVEAVKIVKSQKCSNVGLILEGTSYEYPLWMLFQQDGEQEIIRHINVTNKSAVKALQSSNIQPCAIISVNRAKNLTNKTLIAQNVAYQEYWSGDWSQGVVRVFIPKKKREIEM
jgi:hypothetical protein